MQDFRAALEQVPWKQLQHAYGSAADIPEKLLALLSEQDEEERNAIVSDLWGSICHQGSVYEASCAAVPFLIKMLELIPDEQRSDILYLLAGIGHLQLYANRDQYILEIERGENSDGGQHRRSIEQFLREGNEYHEPQWMHLAHQNIGEGIPIYLSLLRSTGRETTIAILYLLSGFKELRATIVPVLDTLYIQALDPYIQAAVLLSLGSLLEADSPLWQHYQRATTSNTEMHPCVRLAVMQVLIYQKKELITSEMLEVLIQAAHQPELVFEACSSESPWGEGNNLREVCKLLAHLGPPFGLQALISILQQGATRWHLMDTARVVESLLDMVFYGDWVQNRYWSYYLNENDYIKFGYMSVDDEDVQERDPAEEATFYFGYGHGSSDLENGFSLGCWGYDQQVAEKLRQCFEQEGSRALSAPQLEALQAVLACEPFWQEKVALLHVYGLPNERELLAQWISKDV